MPSSRPSFLRTSIGRAAVAGAATLVTVTGFAPAAMAADDLAPESGTPDGSSETLRSASAQSTDEVEDTGAGDTPAEEQTPPPADQQEPPAKQTEDPAPQDSPDPEQTPEETGPVGGEDGSTTDEETLEPELVEVAAAELSLQDDSASVVQGRTVTVDVLGNDSSDDRIRSLTIDGQGDHGDAVVVGSRGDGDFQTVPGQGSLRIEFDADEDYFGADSFTYRVTTQDGTTDTATVEIDVEEYVAPPVEANFGETKVRIGVQLADGSYVPEGTTTAGSVIRIQEKPLDGSTPDPTFCTTSSSAGTESTCSSFEGNPGSTYVFTQESAPAGIVPSTRRIVVDPCINQIIETPVGPITSICGLGERPVTFVDRGSILPEANDDSAASRGGDSVDIDVLANDDSDDPGTTLEVDQQPRGGTAEVVGQADRPDEEVPGDVGIFAVPTAGSQVVRYTPEPGFEGIDDFTYRLTNGNGSDTATVTVAVSDNGAVTPVDPDDAGNTSDGSVAGSGSGQVLTAGAGLPSAGGPDQGLLLLGGALLVGGAAAVAGTRRRRDVAGA